MDQRREHRLCEPRRPELLSYSFFLGLIATTFLV